VHFQISPLVMMAGIMIFYIILGCVMDEMSRAFFGLNPSEKSLWFGILIR